MNLTQETLRIQKKIDELKIARCYPTFGETQAHKLMYLPQQLQSD